MSAPAVAATLELLLPLAVLTHPNQGQALSARFRTALAQHPHIGSVDLRFH